MSHLHEICIYIWVVYSLCFFCCLFITVTWWYVWCFEWASGNQEEVQACLVTLWLFIISCYSLSGLGSIPFFNSIPIPLFSIPIPIPIPLLTITFNSNSNSGDFHSNSNSNSGDLKSRKSQFQKWPVDVFLEIDYNHKVHVCNIIVVNIISLISFVSYINMASRLILYQ